MRKTTIAILALLMLGLVACSGRYKPGDTAAAGTDGDTGAQDETGASADCAQAGGDATITISGFAYDVTCLTVDAASGVTIVNQDQSAHSFSVEGGVIDETLDAGQTVKVKSLSELGAGTYGFNCRFHPPMTGTLIVE